jgi:hypothetical protein
MFKNNKIDTQHFEHHVQGHVAFEKFEGYKKKKQKKTQFYFINELKP